MNQTIANRTASVKADEPQAGGLAVVPILGPSHERPDYRLLEGEALQRVRVTEISEGGSVPELKVLNDLEWAVFLMDGQELLGAKQNRILNTDVLVPARSTTSIPVSCVEAGRWQYRSPQFTPGKTASHSIRSRKPQRVHEALKRDGRHDADQRAVWDEVGEALASAGAHSDSAALHEAYQKRQAELAQCRSRLRLPEDAVGLAVFRQEQFMGLDLFDRHSTLKYFWESLVDSYAIEFLADAVAPGEPARTPLASQVKKLLDKAAKGAWEEFRSPGLGRDCRLNSRSLSGSALVAEDAVIHLQIFPKQAQPNPRIHRTRVY